MENVAPYDFAGGSATTANAFDTTKIADGAHTITALVKRSDSTTAVVSAQFTVANAAQPAPASELRVSGAANRSASMPLAGATVSGNAYVFTAPGTPTSQVSF